MAFQIPSSTLFHSLLHSKHPIVSSQKRNRYTHSLKDTCRGTWRSKVSKCKEERLWFFYQKLFKYKNSYDIKVTIKGYYFVVNSDEIKLFLLLNQYQMSVGSIPYLYYGYYDLKYLGLIHCLWHHLQMIKLICEQTKTNLKV